ncbi:MAG: hypothetical protein HFH51_05515 [Lachnospiraceae bacterium]|nr:hypothetical protein [Lachnospiraceae bacterium]
MGCPRLRQGGAGIRHQRGAGENGQLERVIVEGRHQPIVTREEFERVQKLIEEKRPQMEQDWKMYTMAQKVLYAVVDDPEGMLENMAVVLGCGIAGGAVESPTPSVVS